MILLIVTIGLLNICLGFGLAMYYGFGPPGLDGIFESLGTMPQAAATGIADGLAAAYDPYSETRPAAEPLGPLAEEQVLGDVRDLADTAQTAMLGGAVESRE